MRHEKSKETDKQARIFEARDRYYNRAKSRPKQVWIEVDKSWRKIY